MNRTELMEKMAVIDYESNLNKMTALLKYIEDNPEDKLFEPIAEVFKLAVKCSQYLIKTVLVPAFDNMFQVITDAFAGLGELD